MQSITDLLVEPIVGIIETHCHLDDAYFDSDRNDVIARARAAGVAGIILIGCDVDSIQSATKLAVANDDMRVALGIHPTQATQWSDEVKQTIESTVSLHGAKVAAIGEIGLDYYWDSSPRDLQKSVFIEQLDLAESLGLPCIIHSRDSYPDVLDIFETRSNRRAVLHCFGSSVIDANRATEMGLYLGLGGVLTYKKSDELREIAKSMPIDRILVETDCPYLAPQRWRGKRNEPSCITEVVKLLAELRGTTPESMAQITAENARHLFG